MCPSTALHTASVNCCCVTNYLQIGTHKNIYYIRLSESQESRSDSGGWFWLRVSAEAVVRTLAGSLQEDSLRPQALAPGPGWFSTGGLSPRQGNLSVEQLETPHNTATGLPQKTKTVLYKEQGISCNFFYDLALKTTTHHHFCTCLVTQTNSEGRTDATAWTQGRPSLGAVLETGCHPHRQFWILLLSKYNHAIYIHLHAFLHIKILYFPSYQSGNHESNSLFVLYLTLDLFCLYWLKLFAVFQKNSKLINILICIFLHSFL